MLMPKLKKLEKFHVDKEPKRVRSPTYNQSVNKHTMGSVTFA